MENKFNYIVPIFNKEDVLPDTLNAIESIASSNSEIILIVDGCTDNSENIVDQFIKNSSHKSQKILMPNVHMLKSVNAGLKQVKSGYSVIMQDDIILKDNDTERKVLDLYNKFNGNLGMISFRYASNIRETSILELIKNRTLKMQIEVCDQIQSKDDWADFPKGEYGIFYPKMCAINGPNVIPYNMLSSIGLFDEKMAPYGYDDPEYCLRGLQNKFVNGLFPIEYYSEIEWGGSRRSKEFIKKANEILKRNKIYTWQKHKVFLRKYLKQNIQNQGLEPYKF